MQAPYEDLTQSESSEDDATLTESPRLSDTSRSASYKGEVSPPSTPPQQLFKVEKAMKKGRKPNLISKPETLCATCLVSSLTQKFPFTRGKCRKCYCKEYIQAKREQMSGIAYDCIIECIEHAGENDISTVTVASLPGEKRKTKASQQLYSLLEQSTILESAPDQVDLTHEASNSVSPSPLQDSTPLENCSPCE
ncbi:hypothetical protein FGO68_gene3833 [Halteria grandinella]|uniref:Uncharacterized protein n=1 Tax=Halteria grandinella TaxID=5974 RepID=A0A8J8SYE4_HALGN|nr:hypothetical protein FGO68_gene3833 [Halteria grandinella]